MPHSVPSDALHQRKDILRGSPVHNPRNQPFGIPQGFIGGFPPHVFNKSTQRFIHGQTPKAKDVNPPFPLPHNTPFCFCELRNAPNIAGRWHHDTTLHLTAFLGFRATHGHRVRLLRGAIERMPPHIGRIKEDDPLVQPGSATYPSHRGRPLARPYHGARGHCARGRPLTRRIMARGDIAPEGVRCGRNVRTARPYHAYTLGYTYSGLRPRMALSVPTVKTQRPPGASGMEPHRATPHLTWLRAPRGRRGHGVPAVPTV